MKFWSQWLLRHNVVHSQVCQDDDGLYWLLNNKKKRIDWFEKHQLYHRSGMSKKHHKLLQAVYGRTDSTPFILDACAGLGNDMFIMGLGGCEVIACEKNPQVFAVLSDMMARAQKKKWFGQENINLIFFNNIPKSTIIWIRGDAFKHYCSCSRKKRAIYYV